MIRCVRLWTGADGQSHAEDGRLDLEAGRRGDLATGKLPVATIAFEETARGGSFDWHTAPALQLVITLSGTLRFETRGGQTFVLRAGDVLLAEDTDGGGHRWSLVDDHPWRRAYVVLEPGATVPFVATPTA